jgi:hypothetical protein
MNVEGRTTPRRDAPAILATDETLRPDLGKISGVSRTM